jgi:hypothetical protein
MTDVPAPKSNRLADVCSKKIAGRRRNDGWRNRSALGRLFKSTTCAEKRTANGRDDGAERYHREVRGPWQRHCAKSVPRLQFVTGKLLNDCPAFRRKCDRRRSYSRVKVQKQINLSQNCMKDVNIHISLLDEVRISAIDRNNALWRNAIGLSQSPGIAATRGFFPELSAPSLPQAFVWFRPLRMAPFQTVPYEPS